MSGRFPSTPYLGVDASLLRLLSQRPIRLHPEYLAATVANQPAAQS